MRIYTIITCCVVAGLFMACKSGSGEPTFDPSLVSADSGKNNPAAAATNANPANVAPFIPTNNPTATGTPIVTTTTAQPAVTAEGTNPPHGQPNHRCDIPVGAPLNSPPGKQQPTVVQTNTPNVTQTTTVTPVATTKTAPGMNPPHGEPGHRCDIAVGAPLNTPKKAEAPVTIPINTDNINVVKDSAKS